MALHLTWLGRLRGHGGCGLRPGRERDLALRALEANITGCPWRRPQLPPPSGPAWRRRPGTAWSRGGRRRGPNNRRRTPGTP